MNSFEGGQTEYDGHSIEELSEYLDRGRSPANKRIESSAKCRAALQQLEQLQDLGNRWFNDRVAAEAQHSESWIAGMLRAIAKYPRQGRHIPLPGSHAAAGLTISESALAGIVRTAEHMVPGVIIGRCRFRGEVAEAGAPILIEIDASVPFGVPITVVATRLREAIATTVHEQTGLNICGIDIRVRDLRQSA